MSKLTSNGKARSKQFDHEKYRSFDLIKEEPYKCALGNGITPDKVKIAMWNVNGIRSVVSKNVLSPFAREYDPDFLCINETKINQEMFEKAPIKLAKYNGYWNFCKVSSGYSGVAIFSKYRAISSSEDLEEVKHSQEGRVLTLQFERFFLVTVYIPSVGTRQLQRLAYKTEYMQAFDRHCTQLRSKGKCVIIAGDMNVARSKNDVYYTKNSCYQPGFTIQERNSFNSFMDKGWIDTYRRLNPTKVQFTWWNSEYESRKVNQGKRLDYFLIDKQHIEILSKSQVLGDVMGSDHCPVLLEVDLSKIKVSEEAKEETKQKEEVKKVLLEQAQGPNTTSSEKVQQNENGNCESSKDAEDEAKVTKGETITSEVDSKEVRLEAQIDH